MTRGAKTKAKASRVKTMTKESMHGGILVIKQWSNFLLFSWNIRCGGKSIMPIETTEEYDK